MHITANHITAGLTKARQPETVKTLGDRSTSDGESMHRAKQEEQAGEKITPCFYIDILEAKRKGPR